MCVLYPHILLLKNYSACGHSLPEGILHQECKSVQCNKKTRRTGSCRGVRVLNSQRFSSFSQRPGVNKQLLNQDLHNRADQRQRRAKDKPINRSRTGAAHATEVAEYGRANDRVTQYCMQGGRGECLELRDTPMGEGREVEGGRPCIKETLRGFVLSSCHCNPRQSTTHTRVTRIPPPPFKLYKCYYGWGRGGGTPPPAP